MADRKLVMTAHDDGQTVELTVELYERIGSSQVGPQPIFKGSVLSFPSPVQEEWMRDMAVLLAERL